MLSDSRPQVREIGEYDQYLKHSHGRISYLALNFSTGGTNRELSFQT